jgi:hypothetical protein
MALDEASGAGREHIWRVREVLAALSPPPGFFAIRADTAVSLGRGLGVPQPASPHFC